jgi:uncharacterized membrane protein
MKSRVLSAALTGAFAISLSWSAPAFLDLTSWTFTPIDVPGADQTYARDMNPAGQIVGQYVKTAEDGRHIRRGFLFSNGVFMPIEIGTGTEARGINIEGEIVGWFRFADGSIHGFELTMGSASQIDYPGADYTIAEAINAAGDIVGFYGMGGTEHGFLMNRGASIPVTLDYPNSALTNVRGINSKGDIVGLYTNDPQLNGPYHGFLRSEDGTFATIDGPESPGGNANGINTRGEIVGEYGHPADPGVILGFLLVGGEYSTIRYPGASITRPWKITPDGQHIVGFYDDLHGFLLSRKP